MKMVNVTFEKFGRQFLNVEHRTNIAMPTAMELKGKAVELAAAGQYNGSLILLDESLGRVGLLKETAENNSVRDELNKLKQGTIKMLLPEHKEKLFIGERDFAYESLHGDIEFSTLKYHQLFHSYPAYFQETLLSDIFQAALFEGQESAMEVAKCLIGSGNEYESPIIDQKLAGEVNPKMPISVENLKLLYYTSGIWKDSEQIRYLKMNRFLLSWAMGSSGAEKARTIFGRFVPGYNITSHPRTIIFNDVDGMADMRRYLKPFVQKVVVALRELRSTIAGSESDPFYNDDVLQYSRRYFVEPAIADLDRYAQD